MALLRAALPEAVVAETALAPFQVLGRANVAWAHPAASLSAAAFGEAERREGVSLRAVLSGLRAPEGLPEGMPGPWFGAAAFDGTMGAEWLGFSPLRFTLPELLAWRHEGRQFVAAFGDGAAGRLEDARRLLDERDHDHDYEHEHGNGQVRRLPSQTARRHWDALVARALAAISSGALDKVVLARALEVESLAEIDSDSVLARLQSLYPACRAFLLRGRGGRTFLGASPELLCRIDGDRVFTEALAGSAQPGSAAELLGSSKDLREHRWVVDHIVQALSGIAGSLQRKPEPGLRTLANVVHLHTPIGARLDPGRGVADVVSALHPTPAVAGVPAEAALNFISEHEHLDRGLYAGLVGWVGPDRAELAVALRCALIRGRHARLFVGAGIVEGSSAGTEWAETELKARALLDALGVAP
jgi:isochorismate synthase